MHARQLHFNIEFLLPRRMAFTKKLPEGSVLAMHKKIWQPSTRRGLHKRDQAIPSCQGGLHHAQGTSDINNCIYMHACQQSF